MLTSIMDNFAQCSATKFLRFWCFYSHYPRRIPPLRQNEVCEFAALVNRYDKPDVGCSNLNVDGECKRISWTNYSGSVRCTSSLTSVPRES